MKLSLVLLSLLSVVAPSDGFVCYICGVGQDVYNRDGLIVIPNGGNRTCGEIEDLGMTEVLTEEQCTELLQYTEEPCVCDVYKCPICGEDGVSNNPGGIVDLPDGTQTTCAAVFEVAQAGGFDQTECPAVQDAVQADCECEIVPVPSRSPSMAPVTRSPNSSPTFAPTVDRGLSGASSMGITIMGVLASALAFVMM